MHCYTKCNAFIVYGKLQFYKSLSSLLHSFLISNINVKVWWIDLLYTTTAVTEYIDLLCKTKPNTEKNLLY